MIAQLTGELVECSLTMAVLDVHGVGYELLLPLSTAEKMPPLHSSVTLYTYLAVREDALTLYGFLTRPEKLLFDLIVNNVKGFGARLALNVLSSLSVSGFCNAVAAQDAKLLEKINGVGKKSAAQLLLDLKGKLGALSEGVPPAVGGRSGTAADGKGTVERMNDPSVRDAVAALSTLGFKADDAEKAVAALLSELSSDEAIPSSSTLIRRALAQLNPMR